jgi:uncharacterized membrane protein
MFVSGIYVLACKQSSVGGVWRNVLVRWIVLMGLVVLIVLVVFMMRVSGVVPLQIGRFERSTITNVLTSDIVLLIKTQIET